MTKPTYEELEAEVERLKNGSLWIQKVKDKNKQLQELTALCTAQAGALNKVLKHECGYIIEPESGYCDYCEEYAYVREALSSPPSQKLLRRMEVYEKAMEALKHIQALAEESCHSLCDKVWKPYDRHDPNCNYDEISDEAKEILTLAKEEGLI